MDVSVKVCITHPLEATGSLSNPLNPLISIHMGHTRMARAEAIFKPVSCVRTCHRMSLATRHEVAAKTPNRDSDETRRHRLYAIPSQRKHLSMLSITGTLFVCLRLLT
jgi:hypothetical protein